MRTCNQCGKRFKPKKERQKVCSEACLINAFDSLVSKSRKLARVYALSLGYQSMSEVRFAEKLKHNGIKYKYEPDKFTYQIKEQSYTPDFKCNGPIYLEYKGKFDASTRKKMLAVKAHNPQLDIRLVFENPNNFIRKKKRPDENVSRNWEWAEKNGFKWYSYKDVAQIKKDVANARKKSKANTKTNKVQSKKVAKNK